MIHEVEMMSLVWVRHEIWESWYQCGMVMVWDRTPCSRFENYELAWFGWKYERGVLWEIVLHVYVYIYLRVCMPNLFDWL